MESVEVLVETEKNRYNDTNLALGKMTRVKCCGFTCLWSPDAAIFCVPTLLTLIIVFGVLFTLWKELGVLELCILFIFLSTAFVSSFLVTCTDPGVYPRLRHGEPDPLDGVRDLVFCRVCGLRRPPRTSHCYQCNVCVQEHDHHCGVIGGCVGRRSLRWFVLYLLTVSSAAAMGFFWIFRSLFTGTFAAVQIRREAMHSSRNRTVHPLPAQESTEEDPFKSLVLIMLFVTLLLVVLLVGGLALFYLFLVLTSTTRRESQRTQSNFATLFRTKFMWNNLMHVIHPPPSMLCAPRPNNSPIIA
ncbi:hypothetical protein MOQ_000590 [Trypanosoma cruzi marinkellei]|uniref:Palmitoyltransferase n=1 Tax=Trypanosoma cruzi marinkellei TaxID=85056 RepID=K2PE25_TRYCR|nr:hypothetical protein MOQ_000590 [Trypanosoma cruzi marinkellei]